MSRSKKLELTWIGKDERPQLEPRILIEDRTSSHSASTRHAGQIFDNALIHGDNLLALKSLLTEYTQKIKCVYIDPPFNTMQAFKNYEDGLEHSLWLGMMRERMIIIHELMNKTGSLFVHIDDNELAYLTILLDEIFGRSNRIGIITFKQSSVSGPKSVNPGIVTTNNYILYYAKDKSSWSPNKVFVKGVRDDRYSKIICNFEDHYTKWRLGGLRDNFVNDNRFNSWKEAKLHYADKIEEAISTYVLKNAHRVIRTARVAPKDVNESARVALDYSTKDRKQVFCSERTDRDAYYFMGGEQLIFYKQKTKVVDGEVTTASGLTNLWDDLLSNNLHAEGGVSFPNGKKPEALIKRCLELSTEPGDLVLDSFAGSGTTGAVAHKMGRRWIMVEIGDHAVSHILPRLTRVIDGNDTSGVTAAVRWNGGGGFRFYRLAPSLLERDRWGNWVISKKYNPAMLAEAMCKHLGFTYAPSQDPSEYWRHGQSSERDFIFVTTHALTHEMLGAISYDVGPDRHLLVCCKAFSSKRTSGFENLTLTRIPHVILDTCEWGRDDYSLKIAHLPEEVRDDLTPEPPPRRNSPPGRERRADHAADRGLFDQPVDAEG